ncbi:hypothetical protein RJ639_030282 [Escallonia herrerae]|uniref:Reverse transcriptase/retrotransposon-derived protein RNase H-like domain-containing protein n=1 Tax=Escallonia herrerae TaxID=1293975 RepID=A0AA88X1W9_9ASTE|nr:hypothetical protein RJ639_030282 [Escallonia herrerae]
MDTPLYGFSNHPVAAEGIIALPVTIGIPPAQANFMLDFVVVKVPSAYNAILGRPALNQLQAVVSTYHLKMKFPTEHGIGEVKGDQTTARQCYVTSCRGLPTRHRGQPGEIDTIHAIKPPKTIKQVQEPTRRVATMGRFISKSAERCLPFFRAIRKAKDFTWTEECQRSFEELKQYLVSPPFLTKPVSGEDLFLYLSVSEVAVSLVLIREAEGKQKPVYYVQALSDFIVECTMPEDLPQLILSEASDSWLLYDDGSSKIVLKSQRGGLRVKRSSRRNLWATLGQKNSGPQDLEARLLLAKDAKGRGLSINLYFTSVAYPQSNGQTENMNRSILQGLKKKLDEAKGAWVDELPKVLWAYRTTPHSVTEETPFLLCFGTEALLPVEVSLPTVRVLQFSKEGNETNLRGNLDLLDEVRAQALDRVISTKQRVARHYNRKVRTRIFRVGDLVLRKLEVSNPKAAIGKLSPNWEGRYKVTKLSKHIRILHLKVFDLKEASLALGRFFVGLSVMGHIHRHCEPVQHLAVIAVCLKTKEG